LIVDKFAAGSGKQAMLTTDLASGCRMIGSARNVSDRYQWLCSSIKRRGLIAPSFVNAAPWKLSGSQRYSKEEERDFGLSRDI